MKCPDLARSSQLSNGVSDVKLCTIHAHNRPVVVLNAAPIRLDEALSGWLGKDLMTHNSDGKPLWDGKCETIQVREPTPGEAGKWEVSRQRAIDAGECDPGDENWACFLVPISEAE
jgi:hypothetical protein